MFLGDEHVLKFGSGDDCNLWVADTTGSDTLKQQAAWYMSNSPKHKRVSYLHFATIKCDLLLEYSSIRGMKCLTTTKMFN